MTFVVLTSFLLAEVVGRCTTGNCACADIELIVQVGTEQLNVTADITVVIHDVIACTKASENIIGNLGRIGDR